MARVSEQARRGGIALLWVLGAAAFTGGIGYVYYVKAEGLAEAEEHLQQAGDSVQAQQSRVAASLLGEEAPARPSPSPSTGEAAPSDESPALTAPGTASLPGTLATPSPEPIVDGTPPPPPATPRPESTPFPLWERPANAPEPAPPPATPAPAEPSPGG